MSSVKGPTLYICPYAKECQGGCFHNTPHRWKRNKGDGCTLKCVTYLGLRSGTNTTCREIPDGEAVMYAMERLAEGESIE
jgi:hypothetical protein